MPSALLGAKMQSEFLGAKRPGVLLDAKMASVLEDPAYFRVGDCREDTERSPRVEYA
jgi:hypothetical protein